MNNEEYVKQAVLTEATDYTPMAIRAADPEIIRLLHAGIGMCTESGEFVDALKKHIFYGRPLDKTNLKEEMADCLWYIAIACDQLNVSISELMDTNIKKLRARYPNNFNEYDAVNRNLDKEREILEGK